MKMWSKGKKKYLPVYSFFLMNFGILLVVAADYVAFVIFMGKIQALVLYNNQTREVKNISKETMLKLGWTGVEEKKSKFTRFNAGKKENIVRVGCFGDSFNAGEEVSENYDYPSLLQQIF